MNKRWNHSPEHSDSEAAVDDDLLFHSSHEDFGGGTDESETNLFAELLVAEASAVIDHYDRVVLWWQFAHNRVQEVHHELSCLLACRILWEKIAASAVYHHSAIFVNSAYAVWLHV